jgi:hypothetical protein
MFRQPVLRVGTGRHLTHIVSTARSCSDGCLGCWITEYGWGCLHAPAATTAAASSVSQQGRRQGYYQDALSYPISHMQCIHH